MMRSLLSSVGHWLLLVVAYSLGCSWAHAHAPQAVVYLPEDADVWEQRAAALVLEAWQRWTGVEGILRNGGAPRAAHVAAMGRPSTGYHGWEFSIGDTLFNRRWVSLRGAEDAESYGYRARGFLVGIRGSSPRATYQATARFIEEQMGIYWLYPGESGWAMSQPFSWRGMHVYQTGQPKYLSRHMFGMNHAGAREWMERNGLHSRFQFHHNLHRIFTEEVYEEHPEFFPLVNGQRMKPSRRLGGNNAQISFGLRDAAVFAGEQATRYFERHPDRISFSLGMNDTKIFGESEEFLNAIDPNKTFRGVADYSNLIFGFMNTAAETLATHFPDRYLGCLAYYVAENVPDFPVHKQVIPYLTADRNQYWNEDFRLEDEDLQRRWNQSGVRYWGTYDYFYGTPYDQVRSYRQILQQTVVAAYDRGARGAVAEINPRWGLVLPMPWVLAHLWWNPEQDMDALYQRFYELAFGPAAREMQSFFEYGDQVWQRQSGRAYWLRNYFHPIQWSWWQAEDFVIQRERLEQARQQIHKESPWYPRWLIVDREWRQMEAGWRYWQTLQRLLREERLPNEQEREQILSDLRWCRAEVKEEAWQAFALPQWSALALVHPYMQRRPEYPLTAVYMPGSSQWKDEEQLFFEEWNRLLPHPVWAPLLAAEQREQAPPVSSPQPMEDWQLWERPGSRGEVRVRARHQPGEAWTLRRAIESRLHRRYSVQGESVLRVRATYSGKITEGSRVELQTYFCDEKGHRLVGAEGRAWIYTVFPGDWQDRRLEYWIHAPAQAHSLVVQMVAVEQGEGDWSRFGTPQVESLSEVQGNGWQ